MTKITGIETIRTRVNGTWLFVKVLTDQPGLYGIGSASDHYRARVVEAAIETVAPLLIGRDVSRIEDIWQSVYTQSYWRNDAIGNTVQSGIDMALWDIKGKEAGMPVYQLLGGKTRSAVAAYAQRAGQHPDRARRRRAPLLGGRLHRHPLPARQFMAAAASSIAPMPAGRRTTGRRTRPSMTTLTSAPSPKCSPTCATSSAGARNSPMTCTSTWRRTTPCSWQSCSSPYRLYFLEDLLSPEQVGWYRQVRQQCATPQAMGELFINPHEYLPLITERLIDFVRVRISKAGGITQARKIATLCEWFGVQTAWQEGGDNDPVNQMAAMHVDLSSTAFGIQEENNFKPEEYDIFTGHAILEGGYLYGNDQPGLGIDIDVGKARALLDPEQARKSYYMAEDRRRDGAIVRP